MEKELMKISLITSILGIILIFILALNLEPKTMAISSISTRNLDEWVKVQGTILNIKEIKTNGTETFKIIRIKDETGSIDVMYNKALDSKVSQSIEVIGKVSSYQDEIQIEASEIRMV